MWANIQRGHHSCGLQRPTTTSEVRVGMAEGGDGKTSQVIMGKGGWTGVPEAWINVTNRTSQMSTHGVYCEEQTTSQVPHPAHGPTAHSENGLR